MKDLYQKLVDFTHNGVYRYTFRDGKILAANQGLVNILSLDCRPEDLIGKHLKDLMTYTQTEGSIRQILEKKGEIHGHEYHFKTLKGEEKWVTHDSFKSLNPENGEEVVDAIVEDITEHKKSIEAMSRLFAAVNAADESIIITDTAGIVQYVNPCFERMTGYSRDEIIGKNTRIMKSGKHNETFYAELWATILSGNVWRGSFTNRRKDGTLFEEKAVISPVFSEEGAIIHFVAVKRDITQEHLLEKQLLQSQKMQAIGRLAGGVAHDFTNMLTVIIQHAKMALKKIQPDSDIKVHLDEIVDASNRVAALTSQLLSFASRNTVSLRVMDVNKAVLGVEEMLVRTIGSNIHLAIRTSAEHLYAKIDASMIEQIIIHMAVNSKDAMPDGGQLTIETSQTHLSEMEAVQLQDGNSDHNLLAGDFVMISVSDSGCGMNDETKARMFEPFFTTKNSEISTGLGLSTVYGIVKRHGGHVTVYSNVNRGTTFTIYIPKVHAPFDGPEEAKEPVDVPCGTETILAVENDPAVRQVLVNIVKTLGYTVFEAESGKQALLFAESCNKPINLLITDIIMPEMDGITLAGKFRTIYPDSDVLFASGYPQTHLKEYGILKKTDVLIAKPFSEGPVSRAIRAILDSRKKK